MDQEQLLDGGIVWQVTFNDYDTVIRQGGAPLFAISERSITNGTVTVERLSRAAMNPIHRVLVRAESTLDSGGFFAMSLAGVSTRPVSVGASADTVQNVSNSVAPRCRWDALIPDIQEVLKCNGTSLCSSHNPGREIAPRSARGRKKPIMLYRS